MSEIIQSTPLTDEDNKFFEEEKFSDTSVAEPEKSTSETEDFEVEADVKTDGNSLIFGKFKSMDEAEKGYKEAERAITRAANLEKEMKAYQQLFGQYEQDAVARGKARRKGNLQVEPARKGVYVQHLAAEIQTLHQLALHGLGVYVLDAYAARGYDSLLKPSE